MGKYPNAFLLLTVIAQRAKRTSDERNDGKELGEAFIGDCHVYGMTQATYRAAKKRLIKDGFITTRQVNRDKHHNNQTTSAATRHTTSGGTIAKIIDISIYNINIEENDKHYDNQYDKQTTTGTTTEKKLRSKKEEIKKEILKKETVQQENTKGSYTLDKWGNTIRID